MSSPPISERYKVRDELFAVHVVRTKPAEDTSWNYDVCIMDKRPGCEQFYHVTFSESRATNPRMTPSLGNVLRHYSFDLELLAEKLPDACRTPVLRALHVASAPFAKQGTS